MGLEAADIQRAVKQSKVSYAEATKGIQPLKAEEEGGHHHDHDHDHEGHHHDHGEYDPTSGTTLFLCPTMPKTSLKP
ncbi:ABC transporter substrate-binding protein [Neisseria gonorrhoeae]|uniref:ABC transporter substrate-binding protein n=1 Tax=Neisseria gonorrhoeae TaxID=485 RepID=A0A378W105_NEIGO|nr:ABC transporter substrate-binding protein [Neisseria gonorrhoeae]